MKEYVEIIDEVNKSIKDINKDINDLYVKLGKEMENFLFYHKLGKDVLECFDLKNEKESIIDEANTILDNLKEKYRLLKSLKKENLNKLPKEYRHKLEF